MTQVSELLNGKIENCALKLQLLHAQAQAQHQKLQGEQAALIEQARAEVSAPADHVYNTDTRQFQSAKAPVPFSAPVRRQKQRVQG